MSERHEGKFEQLSRRRVLAIFGGVLGMAVVGCAGSESTGDPSCTHTLEGEVGPYFTDDLSSGFNRSDLRASVDGTNLQAGVPLTLTLTVVDGDNACAPYANSQVDIWHCNAAGTYSNEAVESTLGQTWLRGYQITDAKGQVTFQTILPGWYEGRTTHIHLRIRSAYNEASATSDGSNTTQLFFPQSLVDTLASSVAPYSTEGKNRTTNAGDRVYEEQTQARNEVTPVGDVTGGYTASFTVSLPITS